MEEEEMVVVGTKTTTIEGNINSNNINYFKDNYNLLNFRYVYVFFVKVFVICALKLLYFVYEF